MVAVNTSGSVTTDGTEQDFATIAAAKVLILAVDVANMADGDTIELRIYGKARSSDTERQIWFASFSNSQTDKLKESVPVASPHSYRASIKRVAGSDHAYPWAIYEL